MDIPKEKRCTCCSEIKSLDKYHKGKNGYLGYRSACKICENAKKKEWCNNNRDKVKQANRKNYQRNADKNRDYAKKYYSENKEARIKYRVEHYEENRENLLKTAKAHRLENRDIYIKKYNERKSDPELLKEDIAKRNEYRKSHLEDHNRRAREYNKRKMKTDINYVIKRRLRGSIGIALFRNSQKKDTKTSDMLGCRIQEAICYLNEQGYDIELHDIDHIIPIRRFDLTQELHRRVAFNFKNMQPLEKSINRSKQDKLPVNWIDKIHDICNGINADVEPIINYIRGTTKE
ncbi:hypothetical protein LCGC14_2747930, partial [marine sediment metagenome]